MYVWHNENWWLNQLSSEYKKEKNTWKVDRKVNLTVYIYLLCLLVTASNTALFVTYFFMEEYQGLYNVVQTWDDLHCI